MESHGPLSDDGIVRMLTHTGERVENSEYQQYADELTPEHLRQMWRDMVIVRAWDIESTSLQRQGELGLWVSALGQEAAQAGSAHALADQDFVVPSYREHVVAYRRGVDLARIPRVFRGVEHGSWIPAEHNFHMYSLVIGSQTLHATGLAMAMDRDGDVGTGDPARDRATICYFGDGATSEGDTNEALIFAAVNNAPIVFFCQNNQFAISVPTSTQSKVPLARRADGVGMPGIRIDGNDVIASYAVSRAALDRARSGHGPSFIEAFTYRMAAHTTSDDPTRYRSKAEEQYWAERDPVARLETYLMKMGELPEDFRAEAMAEGKAIAERTRSEIRALGAPPVLSMFDNVYAEPHATIDAERAWFERFQRSFVDVEAQG